MSVCIRNHICNDYGIDVYVFRQQFLVNTKEQLDIPVLLTGGVKSEEDAEALLQEQCADMIGIGRILLKDPQALHLS